MALTKINFYLGLLFIVVSIGATFLTFIVDISGDKNIILDNESEEYATQYASYFDNTNIGNITSADISQLEEDNMISSDNETGQQSVQDNLATLNFYKEKVQRIVNYIKVIYSFPTFIIQSFGIDAGNFSGIINLIGVLLFIGILIALMRLLK